MIFADVHAVPPVMTSHGLRNLNSRIDPQLAELLAGSDPHELVRVELSVADAVTARELTHEMESRFVTLDDRRRYGLRRLREVAAVTQQRLMASLRELEEIGKARNIESHWLTNTVSADLLPEAVDSVSMRDDVSRVFQRRQPKSIEPDRFSVFAPRLAAAVEPNLIFIGADSAWRMGYTGEGRIVCVFDRDGVDGAHPALHANWKGLDGDSGAAWRGFNSFPVAHYEHGTHLMGILVGHDDLTGDTIGVAPGAKWIASLEWEFEWAADPDGDPNTTADMPDAINISAGWWFSWCVDWEWESIDMVEALGIVVVFSAGNSGSGPYTLDSPADRALDSLTNFAVGSVNHRTGLVWWSSSRGPSDCDSISIKPNLCAPGVAIRSSFPGGMYDELGGTSMAAPHVTGAVALLRQFAPNATTREIKAALLAGATHAGSPYPNNDYGWGILNIPGAMAALGDRHSPDLEVSAFEYGPVPVADTLAGTIRVVNRGDPVEYAYASFDPPRPGVRVISDSIAFGPILTGAVAQGVRDFKCVFDDSLWPEQIVQLGLTLHGPLGYVKNATLQIQAGNPGEREYYTHRTARLQFTVSNFGQYGFGSASFGDLGYPGFRFGYTSDNTLFDASFLVAVDSTRVADCFRTMDAESDNDFWHSADHRMATRSPGPFADQETESVYDDGRSEHRLGVHLVQKTYSWLSADDDSYVILEYEITNEGHEELGNLVAGVAFDWIHPGRCRGDSGANAGYSAADGLGYLFYRTCAGDSIRFRGLAVLNLEGVLAYRLKVHAVAPASGMSEADKYNGLAVAGFDTSQANDDGEYPLQILSTGPFSVGPGESDTAAFVLVAGESREELLESLRRARAKWSSRVPAGIEDAGDQRPAAFELTGNYPNPFNSGTAIQFSLARPSEVSLSVYNVLGRWVATPHIGLLAAGKHEVKWDGQMSHGGEAPSGLYFCRLTAGGHSQTRKMLLLR